MTNRLPHDTLYTPTKNNGVKMKIGDLVTLSSAGCKAQGNWRQRSCATFGIIIRTIEDKYHRVKWIYPQEYSEYAKRRPTGHRRYELKKFKKS